ncbi:hypothetical protein PLESTB_000350700 [Pleodorina starrii]|uniref:Uncharacterized protein n=1 Tax=Pleodorina starrii TaxID=330485 RepID=A0A9W6EZD7_9CHLO|nr:hypothetical protein PLESTB_000350700 [Pleodorina starrii]
MCAGFRPRTRRKPYVCANAAAATPRDPWVRFGSLDVRLEERPELRGAAALEAFDCRLPRAVAALARAGAWRAAVEGGGAGGFVAGNGGGDRGGGGGGAASAVSPGSSLPPAAPRRPDLPMYGDPDPSPDLNRGSNSGSDLDLDPGMDDAQLQLLARRWVSFWLGVCVCNSVVLEPHPAADRPPAYQGPSPDEVALLEASRQLGFELAARWRDTLELRVATPPPHLPHKQAPTAAAEAAAAAAAPFALPPAAAASAGGGAEGEPLPLVVRYRLLNVLEFTSARKRMSVVVQAPDGSLALHTKGADSVVIPRLAAAEEEAEAEVEAEAGADPHQAAAVDSLHHFATQGLRTLVLAARPLPDRAWYDNWDARYQAAAAAVHTDPRVRAAALDALADEIERELQLVGVAAIEDQLQEGVPAAVATLLSAGVRVWMITGDKLETAVNIARAARLVTQPHDSQLLVLREHEEEAIRRQLGSLAQRAAAINAAAKGLAQPGKPRGAAGDAETAAAATATAAAATPDEIPSRQQPIPPPPPPLPPPAPQQELPTGRPQQQQQQQQQKQKQKQQMPPDRRPLEVQMSQSAPAGPTDGLPYDSERGGGRHAAAPHARGDGDPRVVGPKGNDGGGDRDGAAASAEPRPKATRAAEPGSEVQDPNPDPDSRPGASVPWSGGRDRAGGGDDKHRGGGGDGGGGGVGIASTTTELVVDGRTLDMVLERRPLAARLAGLCASCAAVVVCRASPAQKAALVRLMRAHRRRMAAARRRRRWRWLPGGGGGGGGGGSVTAVPHFVAARLRALTAMLGGLRSGGGGRGRGGEEERGGGGDRGGGEGEEEAEDGDWGDAGGGGGGGGGDGDDDPRDREGVLLAIGDGANDVAMIQAADVGVGVMGKEGRQVSTACVCAV